MLKASHGLMNCATLSAAFTSSGRVSDDLEGNAKQGLEGLCREVLSQGP